MHYVFRNTSFLGAAAFALAQASCGGDGAAPAGGGPAAAPAGVGAALGPSGAGREGGGPAAGVANGRLGAPAQSAEGSRGMAVSSNRDAALVGAGVLATGGNAVDAAVAMQLALNVAEPMFSGVGGGGFLMIYSAARGEVTIVDSRERAPAGASPTMFLRDGAPVPFPERQTLGVAVGVPGTPRGLDAALARYGSRPRWLLALPAISLAEGGVTVTPQLAASIANSAAKLSLSPGAAALFLPGGVPLAAGATLVQRDLGRTLRLLAARGADAIYDGEVADAVVAAVAARGGGLTRADLAAYDVTFDAPVWGRYRGFDLASMPPPSSGGLTALQMLGILERFDLGAYPPASFPKTNLFLQAQELAFADRGKYLGDPEFVDVPATGWLHPAYLDARAALIGPDVVNAAIAPGDPWAYEPAPAPPAAPGRPEDHALSHTTHFATADRWGNLVSYTSTIEQEFGTGILVPGYGFFLNNELTDFDAVPGGPNEARPGKRPLSSMSPTIVFRDGAPVMTLGSPGGPRIIAAVVQAFVNLVDHQMDLKSALDAGRVFSGAFPNVRWEASFPADTRAQLAAAGYALDPAPLEVGNVNAIVIDRANDRFVGGADARRGGVAVGVSCGDVD
jgi:gamma-glutamyltranspeptidase/glutathione hydrolase